MARELRGPDPGLDPWEPDPRWHPSRRKAFAAYRDQEGKRSLRRLGAELGKSAALVERWSVEDDWQDRVAAWDAEVDRRKREEFAAGGEDAARRLAEDAAELQQALMDPARSFLRKLEATRALGKDPYAGMSTAEMIRLMSTAARALAQVATVERLARGQSTGNLAGHDGGALVPADVKSKTDDELRAYLMGVEDQTKRMLQETDRLVGAPDG